MGQRSEKKFILSLPPPFFFKVQTPAASATLSILVATLCSHVISSLTYFHKDEHNISNRCQEEDNIFDAQMRRFQ